MGGAPDLEARAVGVDSGSEGTKYKVYTFEEAYEGALAYFYGDVYAAANWVKKYALKDSQENLYETSPEQMHHRIAYEIARVEANYPNPMSEEDVFSLLDRFRYIVPQGGPMAGIGNDRQVVSLSNCFVIGNGADSYGGILQTDEEQVQLMKRRGGVGHDLSHLRPAKAPVNNSALNSTGVVSFMGRYSNSTREVAQDGRRGALMLSVSVKHPDAESFVDAKLLEGKVTGANISVRIDDEFMHAVKEGRHYVQQFPVDSANPSVRKEIDAGALWKKIVHNAWKSGEPGVLFWDTILRESVPDCYADLGYETVSTNPCGEVPLCRDDSCRLLLQNLYGYVNNPFTDSAEFDWGLFSTHVDNAQRMMDDIVDLEIEKMDSILNKINLDSEPEEIKAVERNLWTRMRHKAVEGRRTGLGTNGEGDMLAALGLRYGSPEGTDFSVRVHKTMALQAYRTSVEMAKERGPFGIYDASREEGNPFIQRLAEADSGLAEDMKVHGRRNIALLTISPGGTTSSQTQTTYGIEPLFQPVYERRRKVNPNDPNVKVDFVDVTGDSWEKFGMVHSPFREWMRANGYDVGEFDILAEESFKNDEKAKQLEERLAELVSKSPYHNATANDIDWVAKVRHQGAVQKWVDHSISATTNVPADATEDLVSRVYQTAWESGCKGVTVYRDCSRDGVLLTGKEKKKEGGIEAVGFTNSPISVPAIMPSVKIRQPTHMGNMHTQIVVDPRNEYTSNEVFSQLGNAGSEEAAEMEALGRLTSYILRHGHPIGDVIAQLKSIGSGDGMVTRDGGIKSIPQGFARTLMKFEVARDLYGVENILLGKVDLEEVDGRVSDFLRTGKDDYEGSRLPEEIEGKEKSVGEPKEVLTNGNNNGFSMKCPNCSSKLIPQGGCPTCPSCGWSKC